MRSAEFWRKNRWWIGAGLTLVGGVCGYVVKKRRDAQQLQADTASPERNDAALSSRTNLDFGSGSAIIGYVNAILLQALENGATEILIEPLRSESKLSYLFDKRWKEQTRIPKEISRRVTQRLKIMADIEIWKPNQALEGRIPLRWEDKKYSIQAATRPVEFGEEVRLRIEKIED